MRESMMGVFKVPLLLTPPSEGGFTVASPVLPERVSEARSAARGGEPAGLGLAGAPRRLNGSAAAYRYGPSCDERASPRSVAASPAAIFAERATIGIPAPGCALPPTR